MVSLNTSAAMTGNSSRPNASLVCSAIRLVLAAAAAAFLVFMAMAKVVSLWSVVVSMERPGDGRVNV